MESKNLSVKEVELHISCPWDEKNTIIYISEKEVRKRSELVRPLWMQVFFVSRLFCKMDMMTCERTLECAALYIHFYKEQILSWTLNGIKY